MRREVLSKRGVANMRRKLIATVAVLGFLVVAWEAVPAAQTQSTPSLGAYAREQRAKLAKEGEKPAKVYTNDNIPKKGPLSDVTIESHMAKTSEQAETTPPPTAASGAHNEQYYRDKLKELQDKKAMHERELAVLE